jgi:tetratricopeptide (TPR) repeat protein/nucleoside phosphorylase
MTAIRLEFDAVLKVDDGAAPGTTWEVEAGPSGLPMAFRLFMGQGERPLRVAVAVAPAMGATATVNTLLPLVEALKPRCIAMCGVCAGRRGKTRLGDVIAADRLYYHDTGKQLPDEVQQDLTTYNLRDDWKAALEGLDVVGHFREAAWFQARPLTTEWRERRALVALRDGMAEPWKTVEPTLDVEDWKRIVASLRERKLLAETGRELTEEGQRAVGNLLFEHMGALPDLSPTGAVEPFRLHVAPMAAGSRVIEDEEIWRFIRQAMRKTLGLEMESAAVGEVAHRQRQHKLDAVVMKGVMDYADHGRDDHFKEFAARAAAECLLWFLREHVPTEAAAGYDDLLEPRTLPLPSPDAAPSLLLNARYGVVPWQEEGRAEILAELNGWADDPGRAVGVRLLHGESGIGKTRLAIEWVRRRRARPEVAGFLRQNPGEGWLERLCGLGPPVVVVIDYAESRPDLVALLQRVAAFAAGSGSRRRFRVLLLARSQGDWWEALQQRDPALRSLVTMHEPIKLRPLASTAVERDAVFIAALMIFAKLRGKAPILHSPIALDDPRFDRVLYLHMAALATVERARAPAEQARDSARATGSTLDAGSLMDEVLQHEERFWVREGGSQVGAALDVSLARQLVVAATLRDGLATESQARKLCERFEERPRTREDDALIRLLHNIYESMDRTKYLPGLEPDLLGEGMVLRVAAPPPGAGTPTGDSWIERVVVAGDDESAITSTFTVLGRASAINPAVAGPWIEALLRGELATRAVLALRAGKAVGQRTAVSALGDLLADALERDGSASIAVELAEEGVPYPTVSLRRVAEWQTRTLIAHIPKENDDRTSSRRASLLNRHGLHLRAVGQRKAALAATRMAVDHYHGLAERQPEEFRLGLAMSLDNLSLMLSELGDREEALVAVREAISHYRILVRNQTEAFQADLARGLTNLGLRLSELGDREGALAALRESVDHCRALTAGAPEAFQPYLAASLTNLVKGLSGFGDLDGAGTAAREAVSLFHVLAARDPEAFQPDLARSLNTFGAMLHELGDRVGAVTATRDAVDLFHALAARDPEVFQPDLARCLHNLGIMLSALGDRVGALAAVRKAVEMRRALAERHPETFQPDLARSLSNLGLRLRALGNLDGALVASREAVERFRALVWRHPEAFESDLAGSLLNLGTCLTMLEEHDEALETTREAVNMRRALAERYPQTFQTDLAGSLNNLGDVLIALGDREGALAATREAVDHYRALAVRHPKAYQPALAMSLKNLGAMLSALGQHELALSATRETADLRRALGVQDDD